MVKREIACAKTFLYFSEVALCQVIFANSWNCCCQSWPTSHQNSSFLSCQPIVSGAFCTCGARHFGKHAHWINCCPLWVLERYAKNTKIRTAQIWIPATWNRKACLICCRYSHCGNLLQVNRQMKLFFSFGALAFARSSRAQRAELRVSVCQMSKARLRFTYFHIFGGLENTLCEATHFKIN